MRYLHKVTINSRYRRDYPVCAPSKNNYKRQKPGNIALIAKRHEQNNHYPYQHACLHNRGRHMSKRGVFRIYTGLLPDGLGKMLLKELFGQKGFHLPYTCYHFRRDRIRFLLKFGMFL